MSQRIRTDSAVIGIRIEPQKKLSPSGYENRIGKGSKEEFQSLKKYYVNAQPAAPSMCSGLSTDGRDMVSQE